ncbi:hypothetical protein [Sphingobacterium sp.]|uniref:hypothetical protein n=1 Tax=Sphingobacterium sp. TaxID=341027 RepID=UPI0031E33657
MYEQDVPNIEHDDSPFLLDRKAVPVHADAGTSAVGAKGFGLQAGYRAAKAGRFTASDCLRPKESCTPKFAQL